MQIKTTMRCYLTPGRITIVKKQQIGARRRRRGRRVWLRGICLSAWHRLGPNRGDRTPGLLKPGCPLPSSPPFCHFVASPSLYPFPLWYLAMTSRITARPNGQPQASKICQFKLVLLGESAVGKSSLVLCFVKGQFHNYQESKYISKKKKTTNNKC